MHRYGADPAASLPFFLCFHAWLARLCPPPTHVGGEGGAPVASPLACSPPRPACPHLHLTTFSTHTSLPLTLPPRHATEFRSHDLFPRALFAFGSVAPGPPLPLRTPRTTHPDTPTHFSASAATILLWPRLLQIGHGPEVAQHSHPPAVPHVGSVPPHFPQPREGCGSPP